MVNWRLSLEDSSLTFGIENLGVGSEIQLLRIDVEGFELKLGLEGQVVI
jgi:hypothetical protein